jgi:PTH1 family peptidyl-tRNA hydrolase
MSIFDLFKKIEKNDGGSGQITHLVVGLGNPGAKYEYTRHNAGFLAMDMICNRFGARCDRVKYKALIGEATVAGKRILLMKPQTFMNNSGEAIIEAVNFYKIPPENVIVISDDITLDVGRVRIRKSGSAGGHNGLKSIIAHLGSDTFPRVKLGVGQKPHPEYDLVDWVLGKFPPADLEKLREATAVVPNAIELLINGEAEKAMNTYNK